MAKYFDNFFFSDTDKITVRVIDRSQKRPAVSRFGTIAELSPFISERNADGYDVYFLVNPSDSTATKDADIKHMRAVFIDLDSAPLPASFALPPSYISSRSDGMGHHVFWMLDPVCVDPAAWTDAMSRLIAHYDADPACKNPARLLRVPGTINRKSEHAGKDLTYSVVEKSGRAYSLDDILAAHPAVSKTKSAEAGTQGGAGEEKKAYREFLDALARGERPVLSVNQRYSTLRSCAGTLRGMGVKPDDALAQLRWLNSFCDDPTKYSGQLIDLVNDIWGRYKVNVTKEQAFENVKTELKTKLENWYYVAKNALFYKDGSQDDSYKKEGFNGFFVNLCGKTGSAADLALRYDLIAKYLKSRYVPGEGREIYDRPGTSDPDLVRNSYIAPTLEPIDAHPQWFLDHVALLIPNAAERDVFIKYLAHTVQHPGDKIPYAILIIGAQGIGKTILADLFRQLVGEYNVNFPNGETLLEKFNGWAACVTLVVINELEQFDKVGTYETLKPLLSDRLITIRHMNITAQCREINHANYIAFSNAEEPIRLGEKDRRFYVIKSHAVIQSAEYYDALSQNIRERAGEVLHYLQNVDLLTFQSHRIPEATEAKKELESASITSLEGWIRDGIEDRTAPFDTDLVTFKSILLAAQDRSSGLRSKHISETKIKTYLKKYGAVNTKILTRVGDQVLRLWIIRDADKYVTNADITAKAREIYGSSADNSHEFIN